jgi:hypothetical protein
MKTKTIFTLTLWLIVLSSQSQLFQRPFGIVGFYFQDVSTVQFSNQSENLIVAGNFFQTNFLNPRTELIRLDEITGDIIWQNKYIAQQSDFYNVRVFDVVAYVDANGHDILAITGSVIVEDRNRVFIARIDENGNFLGAKYYTNMADEGFFAQGLSIIHTLNGPSGRGFVVGGFTNMDYNHSTNDVHRGFVMYVEEESLNPAWTINVFSNNPASEYDMVSDITETGEGYFITGSIGAEVNGILQQTVLCLEIDFNGNFRWMNSYLTGNYRDVGVDAYYDQSTQEIYLLTNYSIMHYFSVTVLNDVTGYMDPSRIWCAIDANNLDRYGFKIMECANNNESSLVVAGYFRNGQYLDEYGNLVQSETIPFLYEFDKATGDQVSVNYFYNVLFEDPGSSDYFAFWNAQMPLIYYPEMALCLHDESGYFVAGYRDGLISGTTPIEFIKTGQDYLNKCYQTQYTLSHNPRNIFPFDCEIISVYPEYFDFTLIPIPEYYYYEISCPNSTGTDQNHESVIEMHPNPVKDRLYISIPDHGPVYYTVYDAKGITTGEGKLNGGETEIDISALSPGLYFIKLLVNDDYMISKVVIE